VFTYTLNTFSKPLAPLNPFPGGAFSLSRCSSLVPLVVLYGSVSVWIWYGWGSRLVRKGVLLWYVRVALWDFRFRRLDSPIAGPARRRPIAPVVGSVPRMDAASADASRGDAVQRFRRDSAVQHWLEDERCCCCRSVRLVRLCPCPATCEPQSRETSNQLSEYGLWR
jgi:hypothetical protein